MKILHVIDYFQPVLGYQETFLAKAQIIEGHEVKVLTSDRYAPILFKGGASKDILGERIVKTGEHLEEGISVLRLRSLFEFLNNSWLVNLNKEIIKFNPDAIHVHGTFSITALRVAGIHKKIPDAIVVFDDHMTNSAMRASWVSILYSIFRILFGKYIERNVDHFVAVTEETKKFMNKFYGISNDRINVIPLGCDTSLFSNKNSNRRDLRINLGISDDEIVISYVGKIIPDKGIHLLVEAAIKLLHEGFNIKVLFVGGKDDKYFKIITETINSSGYGNNFIFNPPVPNSELPKYYSITDIGVWPKQCSLTVLEAMACNVPVVLSNNSGANERVEGLDPHCLYQDSNVEDLKNNIKYFIDNDIRLNVGRMSREKVENFNWNTIATKFNHLYTLKKEIKGDK